MNVQDLINELSQVKDKTKPIKFFLNWEDFIDVNSLADNDEEVLLGNDLPEEMYEEDYRWERTA